MASEAAFEMEVIHVGKPRDRIPGTYGCGCPIGSGADCPKPSCPGKWEWGRAAHSLHSERYVPDAPL